MGSTLEYTTVRDSKMHSDWCLLSKMKKNWTKIIFSRLHNTTPISVIDPWLIAFSIASGINYIKLSCWKHTKMFNLRQTFKPVLSTFETFIRKDFTKKHNLANISQDSSATDIIFQDLRINASFHRTEAKSKLTS